MKRSFVPFLVLSALLVACGGEYGGASDGAPGDGSPGDPIDAPAGYGALEVALEQDDVPGGDLDVWLRVQSPDGALVAERRAPLGPSTMVLEVVYVPQGSYDVLLDVLDADGAALWAGMATEVTVLAGRQTGITIPLQPAGGVQVAVDLASGGDAFVSYYQTQQLPFAVLGFAGTQHVVREEVPGQPGVYEYVDEYVAIFGAAEAGASAPVEYRIERVGDMATLADDYLIGDTIHGTGMNFCGLAYHDKLSMAAAGDELYVACARPDRVFLYQMGERADGAPAATEMASVPVTRHTSPDGVFDQLVHCGLLIDNQFNLFCAVSEWDESAPNPRSSWSIVHAWSADGRTWSPLVPYRELADGETDDGVPPKVEPTLHLGGDGKNRLTHVVPFEVAGVYRLYLFGQNVVPSGSRPFVHLSRSVDRVHWSALDFADLPNGVLATSPSAIPQYRGAAVYLADNGWFFAVATPEGAREFWWDSF